MVSTMIAVAKFAGYAAVGVTGAISATAMAIPFVILGQEAVKSCTRKRKGWGQIGDVIEKLEELRKTSLPTDLRKHVKRNYNLKDQKVLNWIGAGSSTASVALLKAIKKTKNRASLCELFTAYLANDDNNDGKEMLILIVEYIRKYKPRTERG